MFSNYFVFIALFLNPCKFIILHDLQCVITYQIDVSRTSIITVLNYSCLPVVFTMPYSQNNAEWKLQYGVII